MRMEEIVDKTLYYAIIFEWYTDLWARKYEVKYGDMLFIITGTLLFFVYFPVMFVLIIVAALEILIFSLYIWIKRFKIMVKK